MTPVPALHNNIWKLSLIRMGSGTVFYFPILVLFLREQGLSFGQVFLVHAIGQLTQALLQIPTGYLADRWHRRNVIILGCCLNFLGVLCFAISSGFLGFIGGSIILGIGGSFIAGTLEALTFESLAAAGKEQSFRRTLGFQNLLRFGSEMTASLIGGFLILYGLRTPFWATLVPFAVMLCTACFLHEPKRHIVQAESHFSEIWRIARYALWERKVLRNLLIFESTLAAFCLSLYWFSQPYQELVGLPLTLFGVSHAVIVGLGALASAYSHTVERYIDDRIFLGILGLIAVGSYIALGTITTLWAISFIALVRIAWGFLGPLSYDLVNRLTTSDMRATVLSIKSMGGQILWALMPLLFGAVADRSSLQTSLLFFGIAVGAVLVPLYVMLVRRWKDIPR